MELRQGGGVPERHSLSQTPPLTTAPLGHPPPRAPLRTPQGQEESEKTTPQPTLQIRGN